MSEKKGLLGMSTSRGSSSTKSAGSRTSGSIPGASALPQVDLLPGNVRDQRSLQRTKIILMLSLGGVAVVAALGYAGSMMMASNSQTALEDAQAQTSVLMQKQAQYAEVPKIKTQIKEAQTATLLAMSADIAWPGYITLIREQLPEGAALESIRTNLTGPASSSSGISDPFSDGSIGMLDITLRAPSLSAGSAWIDGLNAIPGLRNAQMSSEKISGEDGTLFDVTTSVQFGSDALSGRFLTFGAAQ